MAKKAVGKPESLAGRKFVKFEIFLGSGAIHTFKQVEMLRDDEAFIQFNYVSVMDDDRHESIFHKAAIAGVAWRGEL